jgi:hypothetical protein
VRPAARPRRRLPLGVRGLLRALPASGSSPSRRTRRRRAWPPSTT